MLPPLLTCLYQDFPWVLSKQKGLERAVSRHPLALYSPWQHLKANIWLEISFTLPGDLNLLAEIVWPPSSLGSGNWAEASKCHWQSDHHTFMCDYEILLITVVYVLYCCEHRIRQILIKKIIKTHFSMWITHNVSLSHSSRTILTKPAQLSVVSHLIEPQKGQRKKFEMPLKQNHWSEKKTHPRFKVLMKPKVVWGREV